MLPVFRFVRLDGCIGRHRLQPDDGVHCPMGRGPQWRVNECCQIRYLPSANDSEYMADFETECK